MALGVLIAGLVVAVPCAAVAIVRGVRALNVPIVRTPGTTTRQLGTGTWYIYERTGQSAGFVIHHSPTRIDPSEVAVTGPDGSAVPVDYAASPDSITEKGAIFSASVEFDVPAPGRYTVNVTGTADEILVSRPLGKTFGGIFAVIGIGVLGGLAAAAGLVLLIVGATRRSRLARPVPTALPPPGWYPDPTGSGQRWWDGRIWTEYRA